VVAPPAAAASTAEASLAGFGITCAVPVLSTTMMRNSMRRFLARALADLPVSIGLLRP